MGDIKTVWTLSWKFLTNRTAWSHRSQKDVKDSWCIWVLFSSSYLAHVSHGLSQQQASSMFALIAQNNISLKFPLTVMGYMKHRNYYLTVWHSLYNFKTTNWSQVYIKYIYINWHIYVSYTYWICICIYVFINSIFAYVYVYECIEVDWFFPSIYSFFPFYLLLKCTGCQLWWLTQVTWKELQHLEQM